MDIELTPCQVLGHTKGFWEDDVLNIWWCPDCHEEIHLGPDYKE